MHGSAAIDAGDPLTAYAAEPGNNGGRVNLGLEGDTESANASAAQAVQILSPGPLGKLQDGVATTINFATSGVSGLQAVGRFRFGGPAIAGATASTNWSAVSNGYSNSSQSVDASGGSAPAAVYATQLYQNPGSSAGPDITQSVAVADGDYVVTLNFASYYDSVNTQRTFDIVINGVTVAKDYSAFVAAGNRNNVAVDARFDVKVAGGQGLTVKLVNTNLNNFIAVSGLEVDRKTPAVAGATALVQASPDGGKTWVTISSSAAVDAYGQGAVTWTPNFVTNGNAGEVRVTVAGAAATVGGFLVANGGNDYYINDASTANGQYTTAAGDDLNSGKTPDAPMASLAALLRAYALKPGDVVFVDAGNYNLLTDLTIPTAISGAAGHPITFQGPTNGFAATLNRANTQHSVFFFAGGSHIEIDNLTLTGAGTGLYLRNYAGSDDIVANNDVITDSADQGVFVGYGNTGFTLNASQIYGSKNGTNNYGFYAQGLTGNTLTLTNNQIFGQNKGAYIEREGGVISGNSIYNNSATGLEYRGASTGAPVMTISGNQIFGNGNTGYSKIGAVLNGVVTFSGNTIYGQTVSGGVGVQMGGGVIATGNTIFGNYNGVESFDAASTLSANRIFGNSHAGVYLDGSSAMVVNNQIYSNGLGVLANPNYNGSATLIGNLIYANSAGGVVLSGGAGQSGVLNKIVSNTIWQSTGVAVAISGGAINTTLADNIIWTDVGTLITIASDSLSGFAAYSNLYDEGASSAPASLVNYGGTVYATLAAWRAGSGAATVATPSGPLAQNAGSLEGDPRFVQPAGADGVLGGLDTPLGSGKDDNFTPAKNSPAIDAGNGYVAPPTDMLGQTRHDDPGAANTGAGAPVYVATSGAVTAPPAGTSGTYLRDRRTTPAPTSSTRFPSRSPITAWAIPSCI